MGFTDAFINAALNAAIPDDTFYVSLHTADPGTTGANELTGNAYARQGTVSYATAASRAKASDAPLTFGPATPAGWPAATHFGLWSASSGGTFHGGAALGTARTVNAGDSAQFAVGTLQVTSPA